MADVLLEGGVWSEEAGHWGHDLEEDDGWGLCGQWLQGCGNMSCQ